VQAQAERDAAQASLQEAVGTNTGLQAELSALAEQLAQAKQQQQQQEAAARQAEADRAAAASAAAAAVEQQLRQQLADAQAMLSGKQDDVAGLLTQQQELASKLAAQEQQCSELQQQLEAEQGRAAEGCAQVAALQAEVADTKASLKDSCAALEAAREQVRQLQHQQEAAAAAASAKAEQLSSELAAVRESSKTRQEELVKQVTEVHRELSAAQAEQERLQDLLDGARSDAALLQGQLAEAQGQVEHLQVRGAVVPRAALCAMLMGLSRTRNPPLGLTHAYMRIVPTGPGHQQRPRLRAAAQEAGCC
jgi:chromosome segregation ATPase